MSGIPATPAQTHQRTPSLMSSSTCTIQSVTPNSLPKSRFPRLQECAHFHYEVSTIDIPKNFRVVMCREPDDVKASSGNQSNNSGSYGMNALTSSTISGLSNGGSNTMGSDSTVWFQLQVTSNDKRWNIYRTNENFKYLDKHLHDCIFDRKFSNLEDPVSFSSLICNDLMTGSATTFKNNKTPNSKSQVDSNAYRQVRNALAVYLERFCEIAFINAINCGPILNWFEIDNRGNRLFAIDDSPINIPGVAAAVVKKRYVAQGLDEISLEVGNMISVIDMPPVDESSWWRGKKELEVGFFPSECVELIKSNHHLSSQVTEHLPQINANQTVRLKHGKLVTILRSFFKDRPARMQLQSKGILKQRVFACDLGEHLSNTQQDVPKILKICTEFIEKHGTVDGIYRHTGLQSNIQRLRNAFDEEKWNEIEAETYINDVHSVSSLLKMYFRELPNPLLTFQLYQKFITIAESLMSAVNIEDKIIEIHDVVQQLPPPHYRTLVFLMQHLHRMSDYSADTNMNTKNLAIVWAPNLLKSKEIESNPTIQLDMLHSITLQANIAEFLIANADTIFNDKFASLVRKPDMKSNIAKSYRPISVCYSNGGSSKLLSLEEAQDKYRQVGPTEIPKYHTVIEIPEKQKKKQKDKKNSQASIKELSNLAPSLIQQPPANLHIQQQFENFQSPQQQQSQLTSSASFHCVSSASSTTPVKQSNPTSVHSPYSNNQSGGSSSPAFKSLFKNFRGSLKHQSNSSSVNNVSELPKQSVENETTKNYPQPPTLTTFSPNSSSLNRTPSKTTPFSAHSPKTDRKLDYSNCISQLQSAAAQAISSKNNQNLSSPIANSDSPNAPVLFRNTKFNSSISSNHSNANGQSLNSFGKSNDSHQQQQSSGFSTFNKEINSPSSTLELKTNPVPSKRRTIQGPPTASCSSISSFQKSMAPVPNKTSNPPTQVTPKPRSTIEEKKEQSTTPNKESNDEMQQLVAYINQFEKENISNAVNVVQNDAYIELTPMQIETMHKNIANESDAKKTVSSKSPSMELNESEPAKLRLSSSSLSSSNESLKNENKISTTESSETQNVINRIRSPVASPDRRTYVVNKIYENLDNEMEEAHSLDRKNFQDNNSNINEKPKKCYVEEVVNDSKEYQNTLLTNPEDNNDSSMIENEPIYINVQQNSNDQNIVRDSTGFDIENIAAENQNQEYNDEHERFSSSSNEFLDNEKNSDENFDTELIELNNQIKQLLINHETIDQSKKGQSVQIQSEPKKKKQYAPEPPVRQTIDQTRSRMTLSSHPNLEAEEKNNLLTEEFTINSKPGFITKSTSIDEIKQQQHQPVVNRLSVKQVRHSFRVGQNEDRSRNGTTTIPDDHNIQNIKSMSKSLHECNTLSSERKSVVTKQRKPEIVTVPEANEILKISTVSKDLEKLSVKTKIKLMESFVSTNPIPISKKNNERSASTSSTGSTSSNSSDSSSKSLVISPKDNWAPSPPRCDIKTKQSIQAPSIMTRSHISHSNNNKNTETPLTIENQIQSHSLTQLTGQEEPLSNENYAPGDELIHEQITLSNSQKQTLIENSQLNNADNILVNELNEVNEILDKMSLDNEILLNKPNPQALATLKDKRRTVKELMSKFENK